MHTDAVNVLTNYSQLRHRKQPPGLMRTRVVVA